jgi:hypothetical protein
MGELGMNSLVTLLKKLILPFILVLFPFVLFVFILIIPVPISISVFFSQFSFLYFILVLFLYYVSFSVQGKNSWFFAACVTALIFSMQLSYFWTSGFSGNMIIGGLLPFRDGFSYYSGASFLSDGYRISNIAAWRPMFTSFVSSLLFLTQHNLMWSMAILVGLLGTSCILSAYVIRNDFGKLAATLYIASLYFYIQHLVGILYTELLGLALGCLGFVIIWSSVKSQRIDRLAVGLAVLVIAVSARAGTFFIFPVLVLWAGWAFRRQSRFSFRAATIAFVVVLSAFLIANSVFSSFIVEPGKQSFGNFAFTLYGQVVGGAGYNYAIQRFATRDSDIIYRAAWKFFLTHPLSFFIGAAKAYRDFFFSNIGIFRYYSSSVHMVWSYLIWITGLILTAVGVVKSARKIFEPVYSFFIAVFIGFLLSIPFLPPIDGGIRIYASTMPLFFGFIAVASGKFGSFQKPWIFEGRLLKFAEVLSVLVIIFILVVPIFIQRLSTAPTFDVPSCQFNQAPYVVEFHQGSYVDILPEDDASCGQALRICVGDFQTSSVEMLGDTSDAEVHQVLIDNGIATGNSTRIFVGNDLVSNESYVFMGFTEDLQQDSDHNLISGCGIVHDIKKRPAIFQIETVDVLQ